MKKFIKENWFKVIITILFLLFLLLYSIPIFIKYENFVIEKKCKDSERIYKQGNTLEELFESLDCILRYPGLEEAYSSIQDAKKD